MPVIEPKQEPSRRFAASWPMQSRARSRQQCDARISAAWAGRAGSKRGGCGVDHGASESVHVAGDDGTGRRVTEQDVEQCRPVPKHHPLAQSSREQCALGDTAHLLRRAERRDTGSESQWREALLRASQRRGMQEEHGGIAPCQGLPDRCDLRVVQALQVGRVERASDRPNEEPAPASFEPKGSRQQIATARCKDQPHAGQIDVVLGGRSEGAAEIIERRDSRAIPRAKRFEIGDPKRCRIPAICALQRCSQLRLPEPELVEAPRPKTSAVRPKLVVSRGGERRHLQSVHGGDEIVEIRRTPGSVSLERIGRCDVIDQVATEHQCIDASIAGEIVHGPHERLQRTSGRSQPREKLGRDVAERALELVEETCEMEIADEAHAKPLGVAEVLVDRT